MTQPLYSLDKLREMSSGDAAFIDQLVQLFLQQAPTMTANIQAAYDQGDLAKVKEVAHKLKPSLDFMGIYDLLPVIRTIEELALAGERGDELAGLIQQLSSVSKEACEQLQEEVN